MLETPVILGVSMVRRKNRRWLVAATYAALLVVMATLGVARSRGMDIWAGWILFAVVLVNWRILGSMAKQMIWLRRRWDHPISLGLAARPQREEDELDEREQAVRNAAYFEAYRVLAVYCFFLFPFLVSSSFEVFWSSSLGRVALPLLGMLLFGIAWTLPQAIFLWTEPDVPEEVRV
jgi:hypothetical protein